ncbi:Metallo-dependent hydrolase [Parathielavia appendiculata]|uniref:Metallo-dependent hydrolase n=1 Tax=Parathielavia appendiculata TaxID=2587402 RepID=A0AAN6U212_9PEZI|nr:Metallo-dependent hydrolase [Parathielavia appendiculata]
MGFQHACSKKATADEIQANMILQRIKELGLAEHDYFYGDHFLSNVGLIEKTCLFKLCQAMPKGAHLHIHFNANLAPNFLLDIAKEMPNMYIWSSEALTDKAAFAKCRIKFSILGPNEFKAKNPAGAARLFHSQYKAYPQQDKGCGWMLFLDFMAQFPDFAKQLKNVDLNVNRWLQNKLVFHEEETHNSLQTSDGAWKKFNARTQMIKELFNYKKAYVRYTQACLEEFARDNIQYAEIRPNFMFTNQVWEDDGSARLDNEAIVKLIISEYEAFQKKHGEKVFKGLKIIYCTPRSFEKDKVKEALNECLNFKMKFPEYIAVNISFLFHCGETLDKGTETDGNLFDGLLLVAKRIGHGFALAWHPLVMQEMKRKGVRVELTDNSTPFRSTLSHDFYQIMAGKRDMTLFGFRQLIEWSITHSCMDDTKKKKVYRELEAIWVDFVTKVKDGAFGGRAAGPSSSPVPVVAEPLLVVVVPPMAASSSNLRLLVLVLVLGFGLLPVGLLRMLPQVTPRRARPPVVQLVLQVALGLAAGRLVRTAPPKAGVVVVLGLRLVALLLRPTASSLKMEQESGLLGMSDLEARVALMETLNKERG